jgi:hypothetical protein
MRSSLEWRDQVAPGSVPDLLPRGDRELNGANAGRERELKGGARPDI